MLANANVPLEHWPAANSEKAIMRIFLSALGLGCLLAMPASAAPTIDEIIAQLQAQGYTDVTVSRTWLGRTRIEAESTTHEREIVFNQRTGEILRDFWVELDAEDEHGLSEDSSDIADEEGIDESFDGDDAGDDFVEDMDEDDVDDDHDFDDGDDDDDEDDGEDDDEGDDDD